MKIPSHGKTTDGFCMKLSAKYYGQHRWFLYKTVCDSQRGKAKNFERVRGRQNILALSLYIIATPALSSISLSLSPSHTELRRSPSIPRRGSARRHSRRRGGGGMRRSSLSAAGGRLTEGTCTSLKHTQFIGCLL